MLRAVSLIGLALWMGGLAAIGFAGFRPWTWMIGGGLILLLFVRALLGPRPRRLAIRVSTLFVMLALMFAAPRWIAPRTAMLIAIAAGAGLIWFEAVDGERPHFERFRR